MPKVIKKKIVKKVKLQEEEVKSAAMRSLDLIKERKKTAVYVLAGFVIAVVLIAGLMFYFSSAESKARTLAKEANDYYYNINLKTPMPETERWKKSLDLFQRSIASKATPSAQYYLGNCYANLGDHDNAVKAYLTFLDKYKSAREIMPLVYQKLAVSYIRLGKGDDAIKTLNKLAEFENGIFKDTAMVLTARYYDTTGKQEEALKKYKEIVKDYPSSPWSIEANARIDRDKVSGTSAATVVVPAPAIK
ncbi:MAG: tetratricopeptide repeat protein [Nitrospirae bacterium]|nr:tetratricopeptide repeat protein [Nitrospirota bacterium]